MPVLPTLTERVQLFRFNQAPGLMLDFLGAEAFRALCIAVKLGVFEALSVGPTSTTSVRVRTASTRSATGW